MEIERVDHGEDEKEGKTEANKVGRTRSPCMYRDPQARSGFEEALEHVRNMNAGFERRLSAGVFGSSRFKRHLETAI